MSRKQWPLILAIFLSSESWPAKNAGDYFSQPAILNAKLSPSGNKVVLVKNSVNNQEIEILDTLTKQTRSILSKEKLAKGQAPIHYIDWISDHHIAVTFSEDRIGIRDLLDSKKSNSTHILTLENSLDNSTAKPFRIRTKGWLVDPLPDDAKHFLYAKSSHYSKVYKIPLDKLTTKNNRSSKLAKVDGGQFTKANEVASVNGYAIRWFTGRDSEVNAVLSYKGKELSISTLNDGGSFSVRKTWTEAELAPSEAEREEDQKLIIPIAATTFPSLFYGIDYAQEEPRSIYTIDYNTGIETLIYEIDAYKILDLIRSDQGDTIIGVKVLDDGGVGHEYFTSELTHSGLERGKDERSLLTTRLEHSPQSGVSLFYAEGHNIPGRYYLETRTPGERIEVGKLYPKLATTLATRLIEGQVRVDGLNISYLLSIPTTASPSAIPLLVLPHGGPVGVFDDRYYDPKTQFFLANGYAVLRVNFRGSSGYSQAHRDAGAKQWGKLMIGDIHAATRDVIGRKDIKISHVCAAGFSYGGYAAMMLSILHPDTYTCGATVSGLSDLNLYINSTNHNKAQRNWLEKQIGASAQEYTAISEISPAFITNRLSVPVMIIHGEEDNVVDIEHAFRLRHMLEKTNKPYQWQVIPEATHYFDKPGQLAEVFSALLNFLNAHLKPD